LHNKDSNKIITTIPEFLIAKYKVEECKAQNLKAKGQWLPSVGLSGKVLWVDSKWVPENKFWEAGLSFSYPIFTRGKRWGDIKVTSNQLKIASEELRGTICDLKAKAVKYYNNLIDAQDIIKAKATRLSALEMRAEISSKKYVNGLSSYCDWYAIENEYINSQRELLNFKKEAVLAKAKWDNFIGSVVTENEKGNE
jgi:outer membrane protein TolC